MNPQCAEGQAEAAGFLRDDGAVLEISHTAAAVLLGHSDSQDAQLTETSVERARRSTGCLPRGIVGNDFLLDELTDHLTELQVVIVVDLAPHVVNVGQPMDPPKQCVPTA